MRKRFFVPLRASCWYKDSKYAFYNTDEICGHGYILEDGKIREFYRKLQDMLAAVDNKMWKEISEEELALFLA